MSISNPRASLEKLDKEHRALLIDKVEDLQKQPDDVKVQEKNKDCGLDGVEGYHPSSEDSAGFMSSVLFSFVGMYWWRTRNAKTDSELLEKPSKRITAHYASNKLENAWVENGSMKRHFLIGVWHSTKSNVVLHAILLVMEELTRVAQPLLLRQLMSYYDIGEGEEFAYWPAMQIAFLISLLSFITVFIHHPYFHGLLKVGNNTRVGTGVLLYKKALRLSLTSLHETNSGQLIQLLNTDAAKLEQAFLFVHYLWLCPLLMIFYTFILWYSFGNCCLIGFLFMMAIVTFQVHYSYQLGVNRRSIGDRMDSRLKIMSEIINGIKVIKMHGWEKAFADKISVLRENEIEAVGKSAFYSSMVMGIYFVSAKIGLFVYIVACLYYKEQLTTKGVFAASALYNSVRLPFALFLPLGLLFGRELISTSRRINFFFRLHDYSRTTVNKQKENEGNEFTDGSQKVALTLNAIEEYPTWHFDDSKTEKPLIQLSNVTTVWYDKEEQEEKKQHKEMELLNGDGKENELKNYETDNNQSLNVIYAVQDFTFEFSAGECYSVIGSVGSGKSSLLLTILAEARMSKGNLDVHGSIAYCAQEPWIFTGTIRENIVFGSDFDSDRYENALELCLLKHDLRQFRNGDMTVVGDNGSTLSGGQRARVALARAVYADADIYLLDDPLSAVDAHVGRKLYENLIRGFLSDKLVILVTHQIHFLDTLNSVILMKNNKMLGSGTLDELKNTYSDEFINLKSTVTECENEDELFDHDTPSSPPPSPLEQKPSGSIKSQKIIDGNDGLLPEKKISGAKCQKDTSLEARKSGSISWSVYWEYTKGVLDPWKCGVFLVICVLITQLMNNFVDWWLNKWLVDLDGWNASNSTTKGTFSKSVDVFGNQFQVTFKTYEVTFIVSTILMTILGVVRSVWFRNAQLSASRTLHDRMFSCILNTQSEFFDRNSEGAILNRFSKDIGLTDDMLAFTYFEFVFGVLTFLGIVGLITVVRPVVIIACTLITTGFYFCRKSYVVRSRELKRIEATARSPLNTIITSTIHGLATIRAYRKENEMIEKFCVLHDVYMAAYNMSSLSARWFGICIDFLVSVFVSIVSFVVVFQYETLTVGEVGLCLVCSVQLSGFFSWIMRQSAELENGMVSVERLLEYTKLESEEDIRRPHDPYFDEDLTNSWPAKGEIEFEGVRVKYSDNYVLNNLNFVILGGQKIGVVGRTGAGKSTLIRVLFGLKEYCSGRVIIDGVDLDHISLKFRRGGMSIIPQEPVIFSGTVRSNLDPFNHYDDSTIWSALEQCELKRSITKEKGLDVEFGQGGVNLSVGQRQLFCLARAMIHHSKILVIDEATANVDGVTDACIQRTIRNFFKHSTIVTVAHRLHTIMNSDRIMVFEKGELVEFDKPITLLDDQSSLFSKMAAQSGVENLESLRSAACAHALEDQKNSFEDDH